MAEARLGVEIVAEDRATATLKQVSHQLEQTGQSATQMGVVMGAAAGATMTALSALGNAAKSAFDAVVTSTLSLSGALEQANIAFTTMLGSGEKAQAFLNDLAKFAATTPFEFPQLVDAAKKMLAMGFAAEQVKPLLTAVGNAAAAMGSGQEGINRITMALGQMQAKTKVQAEEMMQLTESGIPAWQMLAKTLGTDVAGAMAAVEKRTVDASTFIAAFQQGVAERFGNMMEAQSKTWQGALSTIKDSVQMGLVQAFQPVFGVLTQLAQQVAQFVQGDEFGGWMQRLGGLASQMAATMGEALAFAQANWGNFKTAFDEVVARVQAGIEVMTAPVRALAGMWDATWTMITTVTNTQGGEIITMADRIGGFLRDVLVPILDFLGRTWATIWQELQIQQVNLVNAVLPLWQRLADGLRENLLPAIDGFRRGFSEAMATIMPAAQAMWAVVGPILGQLQTWLTSHLATAAEAAMRSFSILGEKIGSFFSWLGGLLRPVADQVGGGMKEWVDTITAGLQAIAPQATPVAEEAGAKVRQAFIKGTAPLATEVEAAAKPAAAAIAQAGAAAAQAATDGLQPLADSAQDAAAGVAATAQAADDASTALRKMDAEARRAQENALAERVLAGEITRDQARKELDAWRKSYEGVEEAAKTTAEKVTAATTQMGGHFEQVATRTEAAATRTTTALSHVGTAAQQAATAVARAGTVGAGGTMGGGIPVEDYIDRLAGFAPKPVEVRKGSGGDFTGREVYYMGGNPNMPVYRPPGMSDTEWEALIRSDTQALNNRALAYQYQQAHPGAIRPGELPIFRNMTGGLGDFGTGEGMPFEGGSRVLGDTWGESARANVDRMRDATERWNDALRTTSDLIYTMSDGLKELEPAAMRGGQAFVTAFGSRAAQAFLTLDQQMQALKQRAQDLMAGITRTAFGTTSTGLNATQIYGGTATNSGQQVTSMYGIPIYSPITPGTLRGYAQGGWLTEPTLGVGLRTGQRTLMAEQGAEYVSPGGRGVNVTIHYAPQFSAATQSERRQFMEAIRGDVQQIVRETV